MPVVIAVAVLAGVWVLIGLYVTAMMVAKHTGVLCLACGRWNLSQRHRPICERCGHDKRTTRDSLRAAGEPVPALWIPPLTRGLHQGEGSR